MSEYSEAIRIRDLKVRYESSDDIALHVSSLDIFYGRRTALVGPNGAGKSTLLKAIAGQLAFAGEMEILSQSPLPFAYVSQSHEIDWTFPVTALDVALMGREPFLKTPRRPRAADVEKARAALSAVAMSEYSGRLLGAMSGGQRQRVFLARALAQNAKILLLDEPFVGVDATSEELIFRAIEAQARAGCAVLVATHDLNTLAANYDHAVLLRHKIVAAGTPADILQPAALVEAYGGPAALWPERAPCHHE